MSAKKLSLRVLLVCLLGIFGCESTPEPTSSMEALSPRLACSSTAVTTVTPAKPTVQVSYTEPTVSTDGRPLSRLIKTTIYYDIGQGPVRAKEVAATKPTGGGQVSQVITILLEDMDEALAKICVTATDARGNEGPPTP